MPSRPWQPALSPNAWLRWEAVAPLLPREAQSVLEVGCGRGGFAVRLARGRRYVGIEPDAVSAEVARARLERAGVAGDVRVGDISVVAATDLFELVCAFEVIEHVEDDGAFLVDCARHVAPGGMLLLTTPAGESRFGIADEMVGHFRRYEPERLERLVAAAGLQPVVIRHYGRRSPTCSSRCAPGSRARCDTEHAHSRLPSGPRSADAFCSPATGRSLLSSGRG